MRWIVDAQLPPALARLLAERGHEAFHVYDLAMNEAEDGAIWNEALTRGAIILTKDEDFAARALISRDAPVIVWLRLGNASKRGLFQWFEPLLPELISRVEMGEKLIEVR